MGIRDVSIALSGRSTKSSKNFWKTNASSWPSSTAGSRHHRDAAERHLRHEGVFGHRPPSLSATSASPRTFPRVRRRRASPGRPRPIGYQVNEKHSPRPCAVGDFSTQADQPDPRQPPRTSHQRSTPPPRPRRRARQLRTRGRRHDSAEHVTTFEARLMAIPKGKRA